MPFATAALKKPRPLFCCAFPGQADSVKHIDDFIDEPQINFAVPPAPAPGPGDRECSQ